MTIARRWSAQDDFADLLDGMAAAYSVPRELVYAIVGQESSFRANAYRAEPKIGDASRGLMQVLYRTAEGLGYDGSADGLFDPSTNVGLGTQLLRQLLDQRESERDAVSAYNGGYRPQYGFGTPLASGQYGNQAYVDGVMEKRAYFSAYLAERDGLSVPEIPYPEPEQAGPGTGLPLLLMVGTLVGLFLTKVKA